jgi:hypothetical protein
VGGSVRGPLIHLVLAGCLILQLFACAGGPSGPGGDIGGTDPGVAGTGNTSTDGVGPLGSNPGSVNPGTRPTPGFTEVEMNPATSTTLPAPAAFLKSLQLNLTPLIEITEVRLFVRDLNLDDDLSAGTEYPGNYLFRLLDGNLIVDESLPPLGTADVPEGTYEKLDLHFEIMTAADIPPGAEDDPLVTGPLVNHSIVVEGHLAVTPLLTGLLSVVHFRFVSDQIPHIEVESVQGFDFGPDLNHLFLAFKVRTWLDLSLRGIVETAINNLSLPALLQLLNGLLIIDANTGTFQGVGLQIETNINSSLRVAPSVDAAFDETDIQEDSFSTVIP